MVQYAFFQYYPVVLIDVALFAPCSRTETLSYDHMPLVIFRINSLA